MKLGIDIGNYNVNTSENIMFKACISNHKEFGSYCDKRRKSSLYRRRKIRNRL